MRKDSKKFPMTPQRTKSAPCSPMQPLSTGKNQSLTRTDSCNAIHKVPTGDSPYVKAKHVQLVDREPSKAIALFWSAINSGDRVDSALKDMAIIMKQLNRTDEAIEAIKSFRRLCSEQAQESLDNVLIDLYKRGGRMDEHIELLQRKLQLVEEGVGFGGKQTKIARSQGKKFHISIEQEKSRLLGNLAWAYMQQNNYQVAENMYRQALCIEPDKNKQCNLAICVMHKGGIEEAKFLLQSVTPSPAEREIADSYIKSFDRAVEMLIELESKSVLNPHEQKEKKAKEIRRSFQSPVNMNSKPHVSSINGNHQNHGFGFSPCSTRWRGDANKEPFILEEFSVDGFAKWKQEPYGGNQFEYRTDLSDFDKRRHPSNMITANGETFGSPVSSKLKSSAAENVSQVSGPLFGGKWKKEDLSQNTFAKGSDLSVFDKRHPNKNVINANGVNFRSPISSKLVSTEPENDPQFSGPLFGGKWKKEDHTPSTFPKGYLSPNTSQEGSDFSGFRKGSMCDNGSNSASKNMMTANGEILFGSLVSSKKLESTERQNDSRFAINRSLMRLSRDDSDKKQQVINGNLNPKLPYLGNGHLKESSKVTVSGSKGETDRRKGSQERLNETDSFGVNWKCIDRSNGDQDQGSKVTVSGSNNETNRMKNNQEALNDSDSIFGNWKPFNFSPFKSEKSWADMVEEEEALSGHTDFSANEEEYPSPESSFSYPTPTKSVDRWDDREAFHDQNLNSNIPYHQLSNNQTENQQRKTEVVDLKGEGYTRSTDTYMFGKPTARRSLYFEQKQQDPKDYFYATSNTTRWKDSKPVIRGNRLQVFQEITLPDSPRA